MSNHEADDEHGPPKQAAPILLEAAQCCERLKCVQWAAAAELCGDTLVQERVLRVHLHASWRCNTEMVVRSAKTLIFEGLVPHYDGPSIGGVSLQGTHDSLGAKKENKTMHFGELMELCHEKHSEAKYKEDEQKNRRKNGWILVG